MPSLDEVLAAVPPPRIDPSARERIRAARLAQQRRLAAVDDDPTGSQSVHGVGFVTVLDPAEYAAALAVPGATCFILTNSRSLSVADATRTVGAVGRALAELERDLGTPVDVISRSDSTLRGHVYDEVIALDAARRDVLGGGYDAVLLAPGMFEAGRLTAGDTHWAVLGGRAVPVGESEFARDATFGYAASDLRAFVAERSRGDVPADDVWSLSLEDIRSGRPERVAAVLSRARDLRWVAVNGTEYADYETVVLGVLAAQERGRRFLFRTGPSFCRALAGIEPRGPVERGELRPAASVSSASAEEQERPGHGLVVVGSHVALTGRQVEAVRRLPGLRVVDLDVPTLLARRDGYVAELAAEVGADLKDTDVMLLTSREVVRGDDAAECLDIARTVSTGIVDIVRQAQHMMPPAWVIAKGGITSHDVAVRGLGIRRGTVLGQLFPGQVSLVRADAVAPDGVELGTPYVVFPGNVGDDQALADAVCRMRADVAG